MKAKFNYDLTQVKDMLSVCKNLSEIHGNLDTTHAAVLIAESGVEIARDREVLRKEERDDLIRRVEMLTNLISDHQEEAKCAQLFGLNVIRAQKLLKPQ